MLFEIEEISMEVDVDATKHYYSQATKLSCDCAECQNYLKNSHTASLGFLQSFGIDPAKILGVEAYPIEGNEGYVECDCHALVIGRLNEPTRKRPAYTGVMDGVQLTVTSEYVDYLKHLEDRPESSFELIFRIRIPEGPKS